jgi:hypothetical protein
MALSNPRKTAIGIFIILAVFSLILFYALLEAGVIALPYPTPLTHYITLAVSPIAPFVAPITLGVFLNIWKHEPRPQKKSWLFITGCWTLNQAARVFGNVKSLYKGRSQCGALMFCGLWECIGAWVEAISLLAVIVCTWREWKWGHDRCIAALWLDREVRFCSTTESLLRCKIKLKFKARKICDTRIEVRI